MFRNNPQKQDDRMEIDLPPQLIIPAPVPYDVLSPEEKLAFLQAIQNQNAPAIHSMMSTKRINLDNIRDSNGNTPLHGAVILGNIGMAAYFLANGADVNCINCQGETPLLLAHSANNNQMVQLLEAAGGTVYDPDDASSTQAEQNPGSVPPTPLPESPTVPVFSE